MLHTKYQGSRPCGLRQEDVFMFPYIAYVKHVTSGADHILAPGPDHNLNKHGRGPLGDATNQISRL